MWLMLIKPLKEEDNAVSLYATWGLRVHRLCGGDTWLCITAIFCMFSMCYCMRFLCVIQLLMAFWATKFQWSWDVSVEYTIKTRYLKLKLIKCFVLFRNSHSILCLPLMEKKKKALGSDLLTTVFHHLSFEQHSLSVWELRIIFVEDLLAEILANFCWMYNFSCSTVPHLFCHNL